jgi:hypothetical protein
MTDAQGDVPMNDAKVRNFADSTTMLLVSRLGMALGVPLILGMTFWLMSSINSLQIDVGVMKSQIASGVEDRYHGTDAAKDFALRDAAILRNSEDISKLFGLQSALAARVDALAIHQRPIRGDTYP